MTSETRQQSLTDTGVKEMRKLRGLIELITIKDEKNISVTELRRLYNNKKFLAKIKGKK